MLAVGGERVGQIDDAEQDGDDETGTEHGVLHEEASTNGCPAVFGRSPAGGIAAVAGLFSVLARMFTGTSRL
ncbi:hypothetical protein Acsp02_25070 [Actinoplanes sp. NBRC 103695]|nr:hypothetical protein Acsp02_25070 [Actinoplanes sp. NBRC 103695]